MWMSQALKGTPGRYDGPMAYGTYDIGLHATYGEVAFDVVFVTRNWHVDFVVVGRWGRTVVLPVVSWGSCIRRIRHQRRRIWNFMIHFFKKLQKKLQLED